MSTARTPITRDRSIPASMGGSLRRSAAPIATAKPKAVNYEVPIHRQAYRDGRASVNRALIALVSGALGAILAALIILAGANVLAGS